MCNLYRVIFNTFPCTLFESLETSLELITANVFGEPDELSFNSMLPTINQTNFVYFSSQVSRKNFISSQSACDLFILTVVKLQFI